VICGGNGVTPIVTVIDLDHVASATRDVAPALDVLVGELGGTVLFGGDAPGFRFMQVRLGDATEGMNIELIEPWDVGRNDFLERFLTRHGDGPHHLTFKVDDLVATLDRVRESGYRPVSVDLSDPQWKEAFLHPREAHGTVVQLAESHDGFPTREELLAHVREHGPNAHPKWWPDTTDPIDAPRAFLRRVVVATPSLTASIGFFAGLLRGREVAAGEGWVELDWPGGGRVRLEQRPRVASPGVDRLEGDVDGAAGEWRAAGARLVLEPQSSVALAPVVKDERAGDSTENCRAEDHEDQT
jgi:catechol 2,3-dioxygenase-like lactoylglutathione lyase family enzyme